jgi:hypothetical protein
LPRSRERQQESCRQYNGRFLESTRHLAPLFEAVFASFA